MWTGSKSISLPLWPFFCLFSVPSTTGHYWSVPLILQNPNAVHWTDCWNREGSSFETVKTFIVKIQLYWTDKFKQRFRVYVCIIWCSWSSGWSLVTAGWWPGLRTGESCWTSGNTPGWSLGVSTAGRTAQQAQHEITLRQHSACCS